MGQWETNKNGKTKAYNPTEAMVASLVGGTGKVGSSVIDGFKKDYENDYRFPIYTSGAKVISVIFILVSTLLMATIFWVQDYWLVALNMGAILFVWTISGRVKYIAFPNEVFSRKVLLVLYLFATGLLAWNWLHFMDLSPALYELQRQTQLNEFPTALFDVFYNRFYWSFAAVTMVSFITMVVKAFTGRQRLGCLAAPLIALGGQALSLMLFGLILAYAPLESEPTTTMLLWLGSILLVFIYVIVLSTLTGVFGGPVSSERIRFRERRRNR